MADRKDRSYLGGIRDGAKSLAKGAKLTLAHLLDATDRRSQQSIQEDDYFADDNGLVTLEYPQESIPVPDHGRYRLHNEIDDCIVCDKCAKICPVNCIEIDTIKAGEEIGKASDGSPIRLYAGKFDIDMAKCCFCGLCTTVCPTECLTMTKTYDFAEYDVDRMTYHFTNLSPEEAIEKQKEAEKREAEKQAAKASKPDAPRSGSPRPALPSIRPSIKTKSHKESTGDGEGNPRPAFRPKVQPSKKSDEMQLDDLTEATEKPRPVFRPKVQTKKPFSEEDGNEEGRPDKEKPTLRPKNQPEKTEGKEYPARESQVKPVFRPKSPPKKKDDDLNC